MQQILEEFNINSWQGKVISIDEKDRAIQALEQGKIIFMPQLNFELTVDEKKFLSSNYADSKTKNVSFDIRNDTVKGIQANNHETQQIKTMMRRFANQARSLVQSLLPHYETVLEIARTSFRPAEILGRSSSYRKDDTRLHVDAFPANPNQGRRILRVFANVNPDKKARVWRAGEPFATVAEKFFPRLPKPLLASSQILNLLGITRSYRTQYDHYMLHLHDQMKKDLAYQKSAVQTEIHFPSYSTWIVYTDCVSHAAMSGQHLFEQTFHLPVNAMQRPELSPLHILESIAGKKLTKHKTI